MSDKCLDHKSENTTADTAQHPFHHEQIALNPGQSVHHLLYPNSFMNAAPAANSAAPLVSPLPTSAHGA